MEPLFPASGFVEQGDNNSSTSPLTVPTTKNRALAREQVANTWKERRNIAATHEKSTGLNIKTNNSKAGEVGGVLVKKTERFSLCALVQKAWDEWKKEQSLPFVHLHKPNATHNNAHGPHLKRQFSQGFPSVLSILQANAISEQVQNWQETRVNENENELATEGPKENNFDISDVSVATITTKDSISISPKSTFDEKEVTSAALEVLPAGYDWNRAVYELARSRSRAFLLLDLTALLRRLVAWKQRLSRIGLIGKRQFLFWHSVQANSDSRLLQALLKSDIVGLATTTRTDLARAIKAAAKTMPRADHDAVIFDSTLQTQGGGKPDAYLRELVWTANVHTIVVNDSDEVHRVMTSLQNMAARRQVRNSKNYAIKFILKLSNQESATHWKQSIQSTLEAVQSVNSGHNSEDTSISVLTCQLDGLSFSISEGGKNEEKDLNDSVTALQQRQSTMQTIIRWVREILQDNHTGLRIDLTGWSGPDTNNASTKSDTLFSQELPLAWLSWCRDLLNLKTANSVTPCSLVRQITMEASTVMIAPVGALCTRIIGVKTNQSIDKSTADKTIRQHYYIDDGCYGSLYSGGGGVSGTGFHPLPLYPQQNSMKNETSIPIHLSTVWGPTCDGLDRVCQDIPLPELKRDDWLVFPNLGACASEGLGTAFNGFSPPDTAYCVLGYFK